MKVFIYKNWSSIHNNIKFKDEQAFAFWEEDDSWIEILFRIVKAISNSTNFFFKSTNRPYTFRPLYISKDRQ
jgi:hypothetical protein